VPRCSVSVLLLIPVAAAAGLRLNEVHYDPPGADGGHEFVELINAGASPAPLAGVTLEFANGAVGAVWSVRWTGAAADTLAAGGLWLLADRGWDGAADAVVSLGLQNGPDAVRLRRGETVLDLLGYGELSDPALFEGRPHPGAEDGGSLARRPDGADSDDNAGDWASASPPTPGRLNVARHSLRVVASRVEPPCRFAPARPFSLSVTLENDGLEAWPGGLVVLRDAADGLLAEGDAPPLAPGGTGEWRGVWTPQGAGTYRPHLAARVGPEALRLPLPALRVGVPPLRFTEVLPAPDPGAPEWIELTCGDGAPVDLGGWTLTDEGGEPRSLPERVLSPGERLLLCADPEVFAAWAAGRLAAGAPAPCSVDPAGHAARPTGGWPVLNNTAAADAPYADRLILHDPEGIPADWTAWGGAWPLPPRGRSLERIELPPRGDPSRAWAVCPAAFGSTPACPEAAAAGGDGGGALRAEPALVPAGAGISFGFTLEGDEAMWDLSVLGPEGRTVRRLGGDALGPGPRTAVWDGRDDLGVRLPPGPRLVLLRVRDAEGRLLRRSVALVVLDREGS